MRIRYYLFLPVLSVLLLCSCGDEFVDSGIQGRWQMQKIVMESGEEVQVDTIFYNFKQGVFQFQKLINTRSVYSFGEYEKKNDTLFLDMKYQVSNLNWEGDALRNYRIQKLNSKKMQLEYKNDIYYFRKY